MVLKAKEATVVGRGLEMEDEEAVPKSDTQSEGEDQTPPKRTASSSKENQLKACPTILLVYHSQSESCPEPC